MKSWLDFWNTENPIYANDRHKVLHYQRIAKDISTLISDRDSIVLDYGSGEALCADLVANHCTRLFLCDGAPNVREKLTAQFAENRKISVQSPEDVAKLSDNSLDLIVMHSMAQYLDLSTFEDLLKTLSEKLKPGGRLVLGDILPKDLSPITDAKALLAFGASGGFLIAAFSGLVRTALSDYRKIREQLGLATYDEAEIIALLEKHGLTARRLEHNPGHNQARMAFAGMKLEALR
jgi:SAM-dependent methyltransferase